MSHRLTPNGPHSQPLPPPDDRRARNTQACSVRRARIHELLDEIRQLQGERDFLAAQLDSLSSGAAALPGMGHQMAAAQHASALCAELARQLKAQSALICSLQQEVIELVTRIGLLEEQAALPAPVAVSVNTVQPAAAAPAAPAPAQASVGTSTGWVS